MNIETNKPCPACQKADLRPLTELEIEYARQDCKKANVPFHSDTALICPECNYLEV